MEIEAQPKSRTVRFFCTGCGKEMWELIDLAMQWDVIRAYPLESLRILLVCSDCLLEEIRAERREKA